MSMKQTATISVFADTKGYAFFLRRSSDGKEMAGYIQSNAADNDDAFVKMLHRLALEAMMGDEQRG